ncbi:retropepsin-like aspartic protease [Paenibacillus medicaginis]|uniref:Retropepsin-like aspartic protease n=1 Tax=Paenibacillus medicaginis TaxID=1470560 RepID=A0ABV5C8W2_9BACL
MKMKIRNGLPFVELVIAHKGMERTISNVLIDTGSAATLLSAEIAAEVGLEPELMDMIRTMRGIGGEEYVYEKKVDHVRMGESSLPGFTIQIGAMDYGFDMYGIIGADFLLSVGAVIDMKRHEIRVSG